MLIIPTLVMQHTLSLSQDREVRREMRKHSENNFKKDLQRLLRRRTQMIAAYFWLTPMKWITTEQAASRETTRRMGV
jgi:hypothetical protein